MHLKRARRVEAYEALWEAARLEAFAHRYPPLQDYSAENASKDGFEQAANTMTGERVGKSTRVADTDDEGDNSSSSSTSSAGHRQEADSDEDDRNASATPSTKSNSYQELDEMLVGWTKQELAAFFPSLARRSRHFPDRISEDLNYSKSASQIAHLLALLRQNSIWQDERNWKKGEKNPAETSRAIRKSRRMASLKAAHEVSEKWLLFEEKMAYYLRRWQERDDIQSDKEIDEDTGEGESNTRVGDRDSASSEVEFEDAIDSTQQQKEVTAADVKSVVSFDEQVLNTLLFLRHHIDTSPDLNLANFEYDAPLASSSSPSAELPRFCFTSSLAFHILTARSLRRRKNSLSFEDYSQLHPCPTLQPKRKKKTDAEGVEEVVRQILLRGVELGVLIRVFVEPKSDHHLPSGTLLDQSGIDQQSLRKDIILIDNFAWQDSFDKSDNSHQAKNILSQIRVAAKKRLLQTLDWKEMRLIISYLQMKKTSEKSVEVAVIAQQEQSIPEIDLSSYSYIERNRIRARLALRIKRMGREAALSMPLDPQTRGKKRRGDETVGQGRNKRQEVEDEAEMLSNNNRYDDEVLGGTPEEGATEGDDAYQRERKVHKQTSLRMDMIGINVEMLAAEVEKRGIADFFSLLRSEGLAYLANQSSKAHYDTHSAVPEGIASNTLCLLSTLLREYLTELMSSALKLASSSLNVKGNRKMMVTKHHVKAATLHTSASLRSPIAEELDAYGDEDSERLNRFRSDPPCLYHDNKSRHEELAIQLSGIKSIDSTTQHPQQHCSVASDSVVCASDAFHLPSLSRYIPRYQQPSTGIEDHYMSDSNESSIYDDSDQEEEVRTRHDERLGTQRESLRLDRRDWAWNEKRQKDEDMRWRRLDKEDRLRAAKHECKLWRMMGREDLSDLRTPLHQDGNKGTAVLSSSGEEEEDFDDGHPQAHNCDNGGEDRHGGISVIADSDDDDSASERSGRSDEASDYSVE